MKQYMVICGPIGEDKLGGAVTRLLKFITLKGVEECNPKQRKHKRPYTRLGKVSDRTRRKMVALRREQKTHLEIALEIGCSDETVRRHLAKAGME